MNWFERYGIVGMFFIFMTGMWFFGLFPDSSAVLFTKLKVSKGLETFIVGFCTLAFLPIGYVIVILGQFFYYRNEKIWEKIHCKFWEGLSSRTKKVIECEEKAYKEKDLCEDDKNREEKLEAILTYYARTKIENVEKNKFLSTFASKRFDVISINRGLMLTLLISFISAIFIELSIFNMTVKRLWSSFGFRYSSFWFVFMTACIVWIILHYSNSILENQIMEVGKRNLREIVNSDTEENEPAKNK